MIEKYRVDIVGSCVSRDSFSIGGSDKDFEVTSFFQECNPLLQFTSHVIPDIKQEDIVCVKERSAFLKRCFCADMNKTVVQTLNNTCADWLIVDSRVFSYGIYRVAVGGDV